jgi:F-type H+-transporting ATPase subunit b
MQETLQALGHLVLKSVPTIVLFVALTVYLKHVFFAPMRRVLDERKRATEGVRELAHKAFEAAAQKNSEFEQALQIARAELYREREALRRRWADEQVEQIAKARAEADATIEKAKREIDQEVQKAEAELEARVQGLGEDIVRALLARRAA